LELVSIDFLVVPTATFRVLFVLIVLAHHRRRVVHFNVTEHPTAQWAAEQIIQAFPDRTEPRYLLMDRDGIYGEAFRARVKAMGIEEVVTAPRSPWQKPSLHLLAARLTFLTIRVSLLRSSVCGRRHSSVPNAARQENRLHDVGETTNAIQPIDRGEGRPGSCLCVPLESSSPRKNS